jgi:hypothetical protein
MHLFFSFLLQWPPLVEVAETRQLPPMLIERYNTAAGEGTALCGIFSDIHRAWATVDNSFFVWRFDKWLAFLFRIFFYARPHECYPFVKLFLIESLDFDFSLHGSCTCLFETNQPYSAQC